MNTKDSSIHNSRKSEIIKDFTTPPPNMTTSILPLTLVVESIDLRYLSRFVVTTYEGDTIRISNFESEEEQKCFDRVKAAIDKVTLLKNKRG